MASPRHVTVSPLALSSISLQLRGGSAMSVSETQVALKECQSHFQQSVRGRNILVALPSVLDAVTGIPRATIHVEH